MKNCSIIFDTNVYRELAKKEVEETLKVIREIKEKEKMRNIESMLSPIVLMELFAHVADKSDRYYNNCKNAIIAAYEHCKTVDNFRLFLDFETQTCYLLFGKKPKDLEKEQKLYCQLAFEIHNNPDEKTLEDRRDIYKDIKKIVENNENQFVHDMWDYVIKAIDKDATNWKPNFSNQEDKDKILSLIRSVDFLLYLALAQVLKSIEICNDDKMVFKQDKLDIFSSDVLDKFPAPFYLYREILERIIHNGVNFENVKNKRENWWWDMQILFCIGPGKVNGRDVYLVTTDKDMINAAEKAGYRDKIKNLQEYLYLLNEEA